jgi:hypothetical protein
LFLFQRYRTKRAKNVFRLLILKKINFELEKKTAIIATREPTPDKIKVRKKEIKKQKHRKRKESQIAAAS